MQAVAVYRASNPIGIGLIEKLLASEITVYVDSDSLEPLTEYFADIISITGNAILEITEGVNCRIIEFANSETPNQDSNIVVVTPDSRVEINHGCKIIVHDLLTPSINQPPWSSQIVHNWIERILRNEDIAPSSSIHYWVSHRDVVSGLIDLLKCENLPSVELHMCGRKSWKSDEVIDELRMLIRRSVHAASQSFDGEDLATRSPIAFSSSGPSIERPDLAKLHSTLCQVQPDGWRTLIPLRVSLMEMIAAHLEGHGRGIQ